MYLRIGFSQKKISIWTQVKFLQNNHLVLRLEVLFYHETQLQFRFRLSYKKYSNSRKLKRRPRILWSKGFLEWQNKASRTEAFNFRIQISNVQANLKCWNWNFLKETKVEKRWFVGFTVRVILKICTADCTKCLQLKSFSVENLWKRTLFSFFSLLGRARYKTFLWLGCPIFYIDNTQKDTWFLFCLWSGANTQKSLYMQLRTQYGLKKGLITFKELLRLICGKASKLNKNDFRISNFPISFFKSDLLCIYNPIMSQRCRHMNYAVYVFFRLKI